VRAGILHRGVKLPLVPGHEFAGVIARVGAEVEDWAVGDRVTATQTISCLRCARCREGALQLCERMSTYGHDRDGGYATHVLAEERTLVRVPDSVPFTWAATAGCSMGTAYNGMRTIAGVEPGDVVVITGATGGTGIHAVEVARMLHAEVVAVTRQQEAADVLRRAGAEHVVVGSTDGLREELDARVGRRADVIFDTVGSAVFSGAMRSLRNGGTYVFFGQTSRGEVHFSPAVAFLHGINFLSVTGTPIAALERVMHCLDRRLITPHVDVVHGWDEALASHVRLDGTDFVGRLVVSLEDPEA
jgi:D-arabinose 1-dehydrogenase-like Zn-dependent alcohol dehydrogenase